MSGVWGREMSFISLFPLLSEKPHSPRYPRIFSRTVKCRSSWFNAFAGCFARNWWKKDDKIRFGMCYKHIPKEYLRRKIIRIFRPNVFGSYFTVLFSANALQSTLRMHWTRHFYTWLFAKIYEDSGECGFLGSSGKSEMKDIFRRSPNSLVVTVNSLSGVGVCG